MQAYYYQIIKDATNEIVDEGIIRDSEDTIYPQQNTGIEDLPYECECHHFKVEGYTCKGTTFEVSKKDLMPFFDDWSTDF